MPAPPRPNRNFVNVVARCRKTRRPFGIRFEPLDAGIWVATWSFRVSEGSAGRDAAAGRSVDGRFASSPQFRGCRDCGAIAFVQCACGGLTCRDMSKTSIKCAWCGQRGDVGGDTDSLRSGGGLA